MLKLETAYPDFGPIEDASGSGSPVSGRGSTPLLAIREAGAALEREREQAAMETQDILTQADEALVVE
jgi:hypothetical protein